VTIQIVDGELCCPSCGGSIAFHSTSTVFHDGEHELKRIVAAPHMLAVNQERMPNAKQTISAPATQMIFHCLDCEKIPAICVHYDDSEGKTLIHWATPDIREDSDGGTGHLEIEDDAATPTSELN
jgi:hypothetical protein